VSPTLDSWFSCKDTDATANIEQADLVEFEEVPSQGLGTSTRRLRNRNRDTPVPVLHDGGGSKERYCRRHSLCGARSALTLLSGLSSNGTSPYMAKKVKS
jgi:hypothetical protein